jgi:hypothetical protein
MPTATTTTATPPKIQIQLRLMEFMGIIGISLGTFGIVSLMTKKMVNFYMAKFDIILILNSKMKI